MYKTFQYINRSNVQNVSIHKPFQCTKCFNANSVQMHKMGQCPKRSSVQNVPIHKTFQCTKHANCIKMYNAQNLKMHVLHKNGFVDRSRINLATRVFQSIY